MKRVRKLARQIYGVSVIVNIGMCTWWIAVQGMDPARGLAKLLISLVLCIPIGLLFAAGAIALGLRPDGQQPVAPKEPADLQDGRML
jgi:hypothetical protein